MTRRARFHLIATFVTALVAAAPAAFASSDFSTGVLQRRDPAIGERPRVHARDLLLHARHGAAHDDRGVWPRAGGEVEIAHDGVAVDREP